MIIPTPSAECSFCHNARHLSINSRYSYCWFPASRQAWQYATSLPDTLNHERLCGIVYTWRFLWIFFFSADAATCSALIKLLSNAFSILIKNQNVWLRICCGNSWQYLRGASGSGDKQTGCRMYYAAILSNSSSDKTPAFTKGKHVSN